MEASTLKISGIYLADDFSFIGLDRQFSIFIMLISIAAPAIEAGGSILSALGHAPFDILTARFIVRLGDSTEDRDYQFTVFHRGINIIIFEDDVDPKLVQLTQGRNDLNRIATEAADALGHNRINFPGAAVLQHPLVLNTLQILRTAADIDVNVI